MKRGEITLTELGYLLLALIVIGAMMLAFSRGCSIILSDKEKSQAQGTLTQISNFLDSLKENEQNIFTIYSPNGYYLTSFSEKEAFMQCTTDCLCICKDQDCLTDQSYCKDINKPLDKKIRGIPIGIGSVVVSNNPDSYSFSIAIEDVSEPEIEMTDNCSGDLADIGSGKQARESVKLRFDEAKKMAAQNGVSLIVTSGYRTLQDQQRILSERGSKITCTPKDSPKGFGMNCPHLSGCAIDVCFGYICSQSENNLSPTLDNNETRLLKKIMTDAGFRSIPSEYWHFEYGTLSA